MELYVFVVYPSKFCMIRMGLLACMHFDVYVCLCISVKCHLLLKFECTTQPCLSLKHVD